MSVKLELKTASAAKLTALMKRAPEITKAEMIAATTASLLLLEALTKDYSPTGVTGALKGAWSHELMGAPDDGSVLGRVYNPLPYAAAVEDGSRPHWAPLEPLIDWVQKKLDISDLDEATQVARLIQFKIAAKGTKGQHMARHAMDTAWPTVQKNYRDAAQRAFERAGF